jgi:hypothetical protein
MKIHGKPGILLMALVISIAGSAQENGKIFFTTSFGLINAQGKFGNAFKSTLAFNSGVELAMKKNWFGQVVFDFNALQYDQQVKDENSPFLFQNTNSSLLLLGLNGGKNIPFKNPKWFISFYGGGGYLNVGEPRVTVDLISNIARQDVARESNIFGRVGSRLAYKTKSNFFQTLYLDASYWASPAKVQDGRVNGFSFYIGTRFGTVQ